MNTKILSLTLLALTVTALAGCKSDSPAADASASATTANGQPMTSADAAGNAATQPAIANPGSTNIPAATNQ